MKSYIWQFITSPGFGGAAALIAASVAALVGYFQYRLARAHRAREQWWATLTWVYDRAVVDQSGRRPLEQAVTVGVLDRLFDQVKRSDSSSRKDWGPEAQAVAALVDMFADAQKHAVPGVEMPSIALLNELQVELSDRGLGRRGRAVGYRRDAREALKRLMGAVPLDSSADIDDNVSEVRLGSASGLVVRMDYRESPPSHGLSAATLAGIYAKYRCPVLVMLNQEIEPLPPNQRADLPVQFVTWRTERDDPALLQALERLGAKLK